MSVLYIALPIALLLGASGLVACIYCVRTGQYEDLESPPCRILIDDMPQSKSSISNRKYSMRQTLEETLLELHEQLSAAENLGPEQREMLRSAATEIQDVLLDKGGMTTGIAHRLQEATEQLKVSHPVLTNTVGRVADLLSQIGI